MSARISTASVFASAAYFVTFSQSGAAPLFALLLFRAPSGLTLRTLFALDGFGDRSHQTTAEGL